MKRINLVSLSVPQLIEEVIKNNEGKLTSKGTIYTTTGERTGRSPNDRFIVEDALTKDTIHWGNVNKKISESHFQQLYEKITKHLEAKERVYSFCGFIGADVNHRLAVEVINECAWHNLFAHHLFIPATKEEKLGHKPSFTVLYAPTCLADPEIHGTNSEAFIIISFTEKVCIIGGTAYAGEQKKALFSVFNYLLPKKGVLPMHCSANVDELGNTALFFGLSGTGKTTLSADEHRYLIGDDEHGWSDEGIFNFEGGCYAKTAYLSEEKEPQIFQAIGYGAILENVVVDEGTRIANYDDISITENGRAAYPISAMTGSVIPGLGGHPKGIVFLTADAFGVLPPISILTREQAMRHFIKGYTSKLAGTEQGVTEPKAAFSACYGEPFLPLHPQVYVDLLGEKIERHNIPVFLVNTGWSGGGYGIGSRIKLAYTRAMVREALAGNLTHAETTIDPVFELAVPTEVNGVPSEILMPVKTWECEKAYYEQARELAEKFE